MTPALVFLLLVDRSGAHYAAAATFAFAAATDGLDGYLARRYETRTRTGAWLDPLADKIVVLAAVITLSAVGRFPWWATAIVLVREATISVLRALLGMRGRSLPASRGAKAKTVTQIVAITLYILPLGDGADGVRLTALAVALALTVATGLQYVAEAVSWVRSSPGAAPAVGGKPGP